jgi:hypothetical protein
MNALSWSNIVHVHIGGIPDFHERWNHVRVRYSGTLVAQEIRCNRALQGASFLVCGCRTATGPYFGPIYSARRREASLGVQSTAVMGQGTCSMSVIELPAMRKRSARPQFFWTLLWTKTVTFANVLPMGNSSIVHDELCLTEDQVWQKFRSSYLLCTIRHLIGRREK